ncbi:unnamed protein product [Adineta ricciae]|uniref:G-protein coupled receptors family 1 profile domain-containing protein n=1 Tax=Adineta ricciae TaxID=249248 RepID=A0A814TUN0_ADIRI|nr:unnamed protein product [Adineta ricciae]
MAFASIERHWLIFYPKFIDNPRRKFLFHYCPLAFCFFYPFMFYVSAIFIHQCQPYYDYNVLTCLWPCYFLNRIWASVDQYFNTYAPLLSIPIFCSALYLRVFLQKRTMKQQAFKWCRDKKMILQLWAISSLYLAVWMPMQICIFINVYWDPLFLLQAQIDYMYLLPYFLHLIYPFFLLIILKKDMIKTTHNTITAMAISALGQNIGGDKSVRIKGRMETMM